MLAVVLLLVLIVAPALFIATQCSGDGVQAERALSAPVPIPTRDESLSLLTLPEWSIVYGTEEYARYVARAAPSGFPYFGSAAQYWYQVDAVCEVTRRDYPFNMEYQIMLGVIGTSYTIELALKGVYEKTVGRLTEWLSSRDTPEDRFAARTAREYGAFMHTVPWFEFPFGSKLRALWTEPLWGPHLLRKWERRVSLSAEYGLKALYGRVIRAATQTAYDPESLEIHAWVWHAPKSIFADPRVRLVRQVGADAYIVRLPRYEPFTPVVLSLAGQGVEFLNIAGNDEIVLSAVVPRELNESLPAGDLVSSLPILTGAPARRIAVRVPLKRLTEVVAWLQARGIAVEHVYDY
jgi:hypothetical protein